MHLQVKKNLRVDLFTTPGESFFGSYHHPLGRDKLLIPLNPISKYIALSQI